MGNYRETFTNRHTVLPVIHVEDQIQTVRNAATAYEEDADGVFLISMKGMHHRDLLRVEEVTRDEFPLWFIGVNYLDLPVIDVFKNLTRTVSGIWTDNAEIDELHERQIEATIIDRARKESGWKGLYFGGVAFKYQEEVKDLALSARIASKFMDVVTTSGVGTGSAPEVEKIQIMKEAIGDHPLGIASGIKAENVYKFKPHADVFLVASSLIIDGTEDFDKYKVRDLVQSVRGI